MISSLMGPLAIVVSNLLSCGALILLRNSSTNPSGRTLSLLLANLIAGLIGLALQEKEQTSSDKRAYLVIFIWSLNYCAGYGIFLAYPSIFSLSQLIVCQSLAPIFALYLSGDTRFSPLGLRDRLLSIAPVSFLIGISFIENQKFPQSSNQSQNWILMILVVLTFIVSRTCARYVARHKTSRWSQPRLTLMNAILLCPIVLNASGTRFEVGPDIPQFLVMVAFIGILVLAVQRFYVFGLKMSEPFLATILLCTSVPFSLFTEALFEQKKITNFEVFLALFYVVSVTTKTYFSE